MSAIWSARLRARGLGEAVEAATRWLREEVVSNNTLIALVRPRGSQHPAPAGIELKEASPADADSYARDIGTQTPRTFKARLSEETECFLVSAGERLVHATWVTTEAAWTREVRRYFRPPPGDAYVFDSYTRPEVRGRGIYPFVLQAIAARLANKSIQRVWLGVTADNHPSLRAVSKAGFTEAFRTPYRRRLGHVSLEPPTGPLAHLASYCLVKKGELDDPAGGT